MIVIILITNNYSFGQCIKITERVPYSLNKERTSFVEGMVANTDFNIQLNKLKINNNKVFVQGTIFDEYNQVLPFVNVYLVQELPNNYIIIEKIGQSNLNGYLKIKTRIRTNQKIFFTSNGFIVKELNPELLDMEFVFFKM